MASVVVLALVACAAAGCAIGNFILYNTPSVAGAELWAVVSERIAIAVGTLLICGVGVAAAVAIRASVMDRLSVPEAEPEPDPEPTAEG
jgi:hypothetical protein